MAVKGMIDGGLESRMAQRKRWEIFHWVSFRYEHAFSYGFGIASRTGRCIVRGTERERDLSCVLFPIWTCGAVNHGKRGLLRGRSGSWGNLGLGLGFCCYMREVRLQAREAEILMLCYVRCDERFLE